MVFYNLIVVLSPDSSKVLMCRRIKEPYLGLLNFVGGAVESGEVPLAAAYRELYEESGLTSSDLTLIPIMDFVYPLDQITVQVFCGRLRIPCSVSGEENPLLWVSRQENFFSLRRFAGEGNIGHIMEHVRLSEARLPL